MGYNWNWKVLLETEPGGTGTYLQYLIVGLGWTLVTALAAWVIALAIGSLVGTLRTTPYPWVVRAGNLYVEIFRNIPLIVQMFLWFFVMPELLPPQWGDWIKQMPPPWGSFIPAVLCLGIFTSVRIAEQVRAGINSLPRGQRMAGTALGLTLGQSYRYVVLPQAFRIILPPLTSESMNIIKNSSVALTIGLLELTGRARAMQEFSFRVFEAFAAATVIYLLTNLIVVLAMRALETQSARAGPDRRGRCAAGRALVDSGFDFDVIQRSWVYLFKEGMTFTVTLTLLAMTGGIIFGTLLAMMRLSAFRPLSAVAGAYVNLMRSVPLVLVIFWFFFLVPYIGAWVTGASQPVQVGAWLSAVVTFTMFEAAYYCEIMRAGIQSVARGQVWAGYALGLNYWQTMGQIVLPQAFRNMLPVLLTQTIILFQDTSLVYVISATDFLGAASKVANRDYRLVEMYTFVAVVYFAISYGLSTLVKRLQDRIAIIR